MKKVLALLAAAVLLATPALAASASITLTTPEPVAFGDSVVFAYTGENTTTGSIQLQCFQGGALVFSDAHMTFPGGAGYGEPFTLGPSFAWTGGEADCTATLGYRHKNGRYRTLDDTTFHAEA